MNLNTHDITVVFFQILLQVGYNKFQYFVKRTQTCIFDRMKSIGLLFIFLFGIVCLHAQQPAYFVLGENQFRGIKVFDIVQDKKQHYYFATNEGIIKYNFIKYSRIEVKQAKSVAFFNLTINQFGDIYFNNLNNQIFVLKNGICKLFYELKGTESSNLLHLTNDDKGNLLIGCKGLVVLDTGGRVICKQMMSSNIITSYALNNSTTIFPTTTDTLLIYKDSRIVKQVYQIENYSQSGYRILTFFDFKGNSYALDMVNKKLYSFDKENWYLKEKEHNGFFSSSTNARVFITKSMVWSPSSVAGVNFSEDKIGAQYHTAYEEYFISEIYEDHEGNVLLGTFDKGVLVIPNTRIPDVINNFYSDPIISIYSHKNGEVYMGSNKGVIYAYKNRSLSMIAANSKKPIEGVYGSPLSNYLVFDDERISYFDMNTGIIQGISGGSLKDVAFVGAQEFYMGTNIGLFKVFFQNGQKYKIEAVKQLNFRIYSVAFHTQNRSIYTTTANGFFSLNESGKITEIRYKNQAIYSEKIVYHDGFVFLLSREYGILKINSKSEIESISVRFNANDQYIKNILLYNNTIIASTSKGLYQLGMNGEVLRQFHSEYGFSTKKVYQFSQVGNQLWVSHSGGVQRIDLQKVSKESIQPKVVLNEVWVNNELVRLIDNHEFSPESKKFEFWVYCPTLKFKESIHFYYKLEGYEENWQILNSDKNNIAYNALGAGKYTLLLKAEFNGNFGPVVQYSFVILTPFYKQWWFVVLCLLLFLGLVAIIYRVQIKVQKEKLQRINELNASKLTAIQSQMNPHFIFNSINSIQDLILKGDVDNSYTFITKFSDLVRKTLNYSDKEFIEFEQEINLLKVYLSLEKLRFKEEFQYYFYTNEIDGILIPPMLIQPFIENALIHGFLHKEGAKELTIYFEIDREVLLCKIIDNGVGRQRAREIKLRQGSQHESFSIKAIQRRFEILSNTYKGNFGYEYTDLLDGEIARGTQVMLRIPMKNIY